MAKVHYNEHPSMFRNHPFGFILAVLLIPVLGAGILILLVWYLKTKAIRIELADDKVLLEEGLLSKKHTQLSADQVRTVAVTQSFFDRIFGVGRVDIYTAGDQPEISVGGLPDPLAIRDQLQQGDGD